MNKILSISIIFVVIATIRIYSQSVYKYDKQVKDLVSRMTLDEKISQMKYNADSISRLNVPAYYWGYECLHGICGYSVSVFPQCIGLAATWDTSLEFNIATAISDEVRALYNQNRIGLTFWTPNINIFRDPRWGRGQETYGEDPFLTARFAVAFVKGMQGDDSVYLKTVSTLKHFAVHSGPEPLRHSFNAITSERDLWETYLPAFKAAIVEGKAFSIMSAYSAYNGIPISCDTMLLTNILRTKWGFKGYITGDCWAIQNITWGHYYTTNEEEGDALALKAGCDLDCGESYIDHLKSALKDGLITEADIDTSVCRLFRARYLLGMFDNKDSVKYSNIPNSVIDCPKHRAMALKAEEEAVVLLKNENNTLPLDKNATKNIFVIGPNINAFLMGDYTGIPTSLTTVLTGISQKASSSASITYLQGCDIVGSLTEVISSKYLSTVDGKQGLKGEYFNNNDLSGDPVITRIDSVLNFFWIRDIPATGINPDSFSVRWTGILKVPKNCIYTFKVSHCDGIKLIINNRAVIDKWCEGNAVDIGFDTLEAGIEYPIELDYYFREYFSKLILEFGNDSTGASLCKKVTEISKNNDVTIFVGGINSNYESEESSLNIPGFVGGDRTSIDLPPGQEKLLKALKNSGKPIILVLFSGSCFALNWENDSISAILQAWYGGEEGGTAIANILFGDVNPSGKLPITYYKSLDDVPDFTNYYMDGRTYRYCNKEVLYPFGYGLSYTTYNYKSITLNSNKINICNVDTIPIYFTLKNSGKRDGDEIVQLYIKHLDSQFPQPIKELKGFKRIHIPSGNTIRDSIKLNLQDLYFFDTIVHEFSFESGRYEIQIGASSSDIRLRDTIYVYNCNDLDIKYNYNNLSDKIYPNPSNNIITFELYSIPVQTYDISIYKINGEEVHLTTKSKINNNKFSIDCSGFLPGVYYISLKGKFDTYVRNFVINN